MNPDSKQHIHFPANAVKSIFDMDYEQEEDLFDTIENGKDLPEDADEADNEDNEDSQKNKPVKPKKTTIHRPRLKLDADRLCGERGIPAVVKSFQNVSFKGKGHEVEDLNKLMHTLEHWAFRFYPKMTFDEVLDKVEKLGSKRQVQTCVKKIRLDMLDIGEDLVVPDNAIPNEEESENETEFVDPFDELVAQNHFPEEIQRPSSPVIQSTTQDLTENQISRMERNRLLAQERRKSKSNTINEGASCSNIDLNTESITIE